MKDFDNSALNEWPFDAWIGELKEHKGCAAINGFLFSHQDAARVYFMTEESATYGVRFDIQKSDIVSITPLSHASNIMGHTLKASKILLKLDAVVIRIGVHVAASLVQYSQATKPETPYAVVETPETKLAEDVLQIRSTILADVQMR